MLWDLKTKFTLFKQIGDNFLFVFAKKLFLAFLFYFGSFFFDFWLFTSKKIKNKQGNKKSDKVIFAKTRNSNKAYNKNKNAKAKFWLYHNKNNNKYNKTKPSATWGRVIKIIHLLSSRSFTNYSVFYNNKGLKWAY